MEDTRQKAILAVLITLVFAIGGYFFFVRPAMQARSAAQPASPTTTAPTRPQVEADAQTERAAETALPEKATFASLKKQLQALADASHVKLTQLLPADSSSAATGQGTGAQLIVQGDYESVLQFLSSLTGSVQLVNVSGAEQLRATGPLLLIPSLTLAQAVAQSATYQATLTVLLPARAG